MGRAFLVGGFLGSGKTTFILNSLLPHMKGERVCILVNDYGEVSYDKIRFYQEGFDVLGIQGSCVCCTGGSLLLETLESVKKDTQTLIVETSGVSEIHPIWESLESSGYVVEVVFCCLPLDIKEDLLSLPLVKSQLESAQCVVLTKADLVDNKTLSSRLEFFKKLEKPIFVAYEGKTDVSIEQFCNLANVRVLRNPSKFKSGHLFYSKVLKLKGIYNKEEIEDFLLRLPKQVYRAKGVVHTTHSPLPLGLNYTCGYISWERLNYQGETFINFIGTVPLELYLRRFPKPIRDIQCLEELMFPLSSFDRRDGIAFLKGKIVSERRAVKELLKLFKSEGGVLIAGKGTPFESFAQIKIRDYTYPKLLRLLERLKRYKGRPLFFVGVPAGVVSLFLKELGKEQVIVHVGTKKLLPDAYISLKVDTEEKLNALFELFVLK